MAHHTLSGLPDIPILLRWSARAKRISLRVSGLDGRVTLTLPLGLAELEGIQFAAQKCDWLRRQVAAKSVSKAVALGTTLPIEGRSYLVVQGAGRKLIMTGDQIAVPGSNERVGAKLRGYLKELARDRLAAASDRYASQLGRDYHRLTLRDTRSRWGSCSSEAALMYSWRLIMAPCEVLEYVAAHEVAHLVEMSHAPKFWSIVTELYGEYKSPRRWLRENGTGLHNFRFGD
ncbi:MAG: SprT family zinc-dependent metalloprotease [Paracoccaceae bacterium]|nr:SprT family zinc-dependent metalloprotease [Paracoccaceae bacterium]